MPAPSSAGTAPRAGNRSNPAHSHIVWLFVGLALMLGGCATIKESDTPRTGIEQLLISSAADRALDKIDFWAGPRDEGLR